MKYRTDILQLFKETQERDLARSGKEWLSRWMYQDNAPGGSHPLPTNFYSYVGPHELADWMLWFLAPKPDYFTDQVVRPLIERSIQFDQRIGREHNLSLPLDAHGEVLGRNNAQDYIMANAYPMPGPTRARRVLDFGAGYGRQANLWSQQEDDGLVFIGVDGIPQPYCMQHFYYSNIDRPWHEYLVEQSEFRLDDRSRGIYHLPTWRLDLIPDNYLDRILAVQVLYELSSELAKYICAEFRRILKPTGALYIRDHTSAWMPVQNMDVDQHLAQSGFTKEFEAHVEDTVEFFGVPRIYRKTNPKAVKAITIANKTIYDN